MNIYAVNLTVDTKTTDLYDKVAVNKYPVIVLCKDEKELWYKLSSEETKNWIKNNIRTKHIYESAFFHIREVSDIKDAKVKDLCWKVNSLMNISY
jgi:hypothetical protein